MTVSTLLAWIKPEMWVTASLVSHPVSHQILSVLTPTKQSCPSYPTAAFLLQVVMVFLDCYGIFSLGVLSSHVSSLLFLLSSQLRIIRWKSNHVISNQLLKWLKPMHSGKSSKCSLFLTWWLWSNFCWLLQPYFFSLTSLPSRFYPFHLKWLPSCHQDFFLKYADPFA